jgi:hypothetical protein
VGKKLRKVTLLGAFEIQTEGSDTPVRDGLILGSRREQRGFVLETSRESIEQIVSIAGASQGGIPRRLATAVGPLLDELGYELMRIELQALPIPAEAEEEGYGAYVQGWLIFRGHGRRSAKLAMTATEAIQVSIATGLPMMAAYELLQLNVSHFLAEIDEMSENHAEDAQQFHTFIDNVTATDFARFYEAKGDKGDDEK